MPQRGTQQGLRNFEAMSHRLERSAMVNAKLLLAPIGRSEHALSSASLCSEPKTIASKGLFRGLSDVEHLDCC
jgi:hypothetical protein